MATRKRATTTNPRKKSHDADDGSRPVNLRPAKRAVKASDKVRLSVAAKELDGILRRVYPLPELSDDANDMLHTNTSTRALLAAILEGPEALAAELAHAWIDAEKVAPWIALASCRDQLYAGPVALQHALADRGLPLPSWITALAPNSDQATPYAVMQLGYQFPVPDEGAMNAVALKALAIDMLTQLAASKVHRQLREYVSMFAETIANSFAEAVEGHVGSVIPVTFQMPTTLPHVVMLNEVRFGFNSATGQMTLDWVGMPSLQSTKPVAG